MQSAGPEDRAWKRAGGSEPGSTQKSEKVSAMGGGEKHRHLRHLIEEFQ